MKSDISITSTNVHFFPYGKGVRNAAVKKKATPFFM